VRIANKFERESSAFEAALCGHFAGINSQPFQSLQDLNGSPILVLDSTFRIALVLHHVVGFGSA
jgi:hypothetical protein